MKMMDRWSSKEIWILLLNGKKIPSTLAALTLNVLSWDPHSDTINASVKLQNDKLHRKTPLTVSHYSQSTLACFESRALSDRKESGEEVPRK